MGEVADTTNKVLVGRVWGRAYSIAKLRLWVMEIWGHILTELPTITTLAPGWFSLSFLREDQTTWVLLRYWHIDMAPVPLKCWSPLFNPKCEQLGAGPIWVRLPGLPLHFWFEDVLMCTGNALGNFLDFDKSYESSDNKFMAWILINLDIREGLEEHITLHWKIFTRIQHLDYEGMPFRCRRCHKVGHLYKEFPLVNPVVSPTKVSVAVASSEPSFVDERSSQSLLPSR